MESESSNISGEESDVSAPDDKKRSSKTNRKSKRKRRHNKKSGFPFRVAQKSILKLPEYIKINYGGQMMDRMSSAEQQKIMVELTGRKLWTNLHSLWEKDKGDNYYRPFADKIRLYKNDKRFQDLVSEFLDEKFSVDAIRTICPGFMPKIGVENYGLGSKLKYNLLHTRINKISLADEQQQITVHDSSNFVDKADPHAKIVPHMATQLSLETHGLSVDAMKKLDDGVDVHLSNYDATFDDVDKISLTSIDYDDDADGKRSYCSSPSGPPTLGQYPSTPEVENLPLIMPTMFSDSDSISSSRRSGRDTRSITYNLRDVKYPESGEKPLDTENDYFSDESQYSVQELSDDNSDFSSDDGISQKLKSVHGEDPLTAEKICGILGVDKSILSYVPPHQIEIEIPADSVSKMFLMQKLTTDTGEIVWDVQFQKRKWASTFSSCLSTSEFPCSFSASHGPSISPSYKKDEQHSGVKFAYGHGHCSGGCALRFRLIFPHKPKVGEATKCIVKCFGAFTLYQKNGSTARRLSGTERDQVKALLQNSKSNKVFLENMSHLKALRLLHKNKFVMSEDVLRTAAYEGKKSNRGDKNEANDLELVLKDQLKEVCPESSLPGFLRQLTLYPFQYDMYMWKQVKLVNTLAQSSDLWLTIDASGRIVRLPNELQETQDKHPLNYIVEVTSEKVSPFPLAEMVTTNNKATNIRAFLSRVMDDVKKAGPRKDRLVAGVVTDMSLALIHACCEAINVETFIEYVKRSYAVLSGICEPRKDKAVICTCVNHVMNAFRKNIKERSLDKVTRRVAMGALAKVQESFDLEDLKNVSEKIIYIFGKKYVDCEALEKYVREMEGKNCSSGAYKNDDVLDFELEFIESSESRKEKYSSLKTGNKFWEDFCNLRRKLCPNLPYKLPIKGGKGQTVDGNTDIGLKSLTDEFVLTKNPHFCPPILELLENTYIPMVPFFSAMVPRHSGFLSFVRKTNAVVESAFKIHKQEWHRHKNMHNGDYVREHFPLVNGKINHVVTFCEENRKALAVPKVSLNSAKNPQKKRNKSVDNLECHHVNEQWLPRRAQKRPLRPTHLSDIEILNKLRGLRDPNEETSKKRSLENMEGKANQTTSSTMENLKGPLNQNLVKLGQSFIGFVTPVDLESLFCGDLWLTSSLMDFYAQLLVDKYNALDTHHHHLKKVSILPSYGVGPNQHNIVTVSDSAFFRLPDEVDTIFVPLNVQMKHWILLQIENVRNGTRYLTVYDSKTGCVNGKVRDEQLNLVKTNLDDRFRKSIWVTYFEATVQQSDGHSCGPSVLFILDKTLSQNVSTYTANDLVNYRVEILKSTLKTTPTGTEILEKFCDDQGLIQFILSDTEEMLRIQSKYPKLQQKEYSTNIYFDD